jgi:hypothetical protein
MLLADGGRYSDSKALTISGKFIVKGVSSRRQGSKQLRE